MRISIVIDCADPDALAPFWAEATGFTRLWDHEPYVVLAPPDGAGPVLVLQRVPEAKTTKNRVHIDLHPDGDIEAEAARLEALGATRLGADGIPDHGLAWIVMADPQGNEFCVCAS